MFQIIKRILLFLISAPLSVILAVTGYYDYLGYEMYNSAIGEKSVSEMAADIKTAVNLQNIASCLNSM